jgi:hypothetical protein
MTSGEKPCAPLKRIVLLASVGLALAVPALRGDEGPAPPADDLETIAPEFRSLRKRAGHFSGAAWNDAVDRWMGRKHRLMRQIGLLLARGGYDQSETMALLGTPDEIVLEGDPLFDLITRLPGYSPAQVGGDAFWVYYWRGRHDFLFLHCRNDAIVAADWWYAGE